jgi:zinc/manganese transport system substrate-binding protein
MEANTMQFISNRCPELHGTGRGARRFRRGLAGAAVLFATLTALAFDPAQAVIHVAASTTDLGSIASTVGGDQVDVVTIARPGADPHRVEVLPSYMVRVGRAQVYLKVGLGLDQWADQIIDGSHNGKVLVVDCSANVNVLEKPTGKVDASMGDVHPNGNPHYWLDPRNAAIAAATIAEAFAKIDPAHAADFDKHAEEFSKACNDLAVHGLMQMKSLPSHDILTYHRSWAYFGDAFGLNVVSTIEPIPGIPPTARHLQELVDVIEEKHVPVVIEEPYFSEDGGEFLKRQAGIRIVHESGSCDDIKAGSYLTHIQEILDQVAGGK